MLRSLILEDDAESRAAISSLVRLQGFETFEAGTLAEARQCVSQQSMDVALVDLSLPDGSGLEIVRDIQRHSGGGEIVVVTGNASVETAVEALRLGAMDYLVKPVDTQRLRAVLANLARTRELKHEISSLRRALLDVGRFGPVVGASAAMLSVYELVSRAAPTDVPVFIVGESGTGKELIAAALHDLSRRRGQPFVPVNCGAIASGLIQSELFGHERGAFTGAVRGRRGFFEQAAGGTLCLDEITEMPLDLQVSLLRVLETGQVQRLGGEGLTSIDVRLVAATNRDPQAAVTEGKLRHDLYFRLNVFPIHLPPLRERQDDVALLADHFLAELNRAEKTRKRFSTATLDRLREYAWPGNVRELHNVVQRAFIIADAEISPASLPPEIAQSHESAASAPALSPGLSLAESDRRLILATLERCGGNKHQAAEMLGISLKTLYNRLASYRAKGSKERGATESSAVESPVRSPFPQS